MPALVVGVDSSTQSTKVEARDLVSGTVVATGAARHPSTSPPISEQDPEAWWRALVEAASQLGDHRGDVVAISVAGQQHGLVLLDEDGRPQRPAKLWNDTTSAPQAARLVAELGADVWAERTGSVPVAAFTITKLAWVAEQEPHVLDHATMLMLPHDYLTWRLTGAHVTDRGDASGTGWFDPAQDETCADLVELAIGRHRPPQLPHVLGPEEPAGTLTPAAAATLGLEEAVLVGPGTGDNMGAALGLGLRTGDVAISLGTSGTVFAVSDTPTRDPSGAVAGFADADGGHLPLVCTLNATKVTDSVARWLGTDAAGLSTLALSAADEPGTATLVPHFDGERTPNRPDATGTFLGLTNATTAAQLALAAHDGVLCGLVDGIDHLARSGAPTGGRRFLVGGGGRSPAYRQRAADLLGRALIVPDGDELVRTGAAAQAARTYAGEPLATITARWGLGTGSEIAPVHEAEEVLERHRDAVEDRALRS